MGEFYVYGAWDASEEKPSDSNALYIGKGSGDRLKDAHPNVPNYDKLRHSKFPDLTGLSKEKALAEEERLIGLHKPRYNDYLK
jgi:hypothetical protein